MNSRLLLALLVLGTLITVTVVPGIFLTDEDNYLVTAVALRHGHVTVANTSGLLPSRELLFFDPVPWSRSVQSTPVASTAPPLYAPFALPFLWLGWRGLVGLNTLAYLATIAMVFLYARRFSDEDATPWLAAAAFALCGYAIEYAQGLWPQALSMALCTAGIVMAGSVIETGRVFLAPVSGLVLALATGVRYQNAVILAVVGACLVLWIPKSRWRASFAYAAAALGPLAASAAINHVRLDSWNPISKGAGYLKVPLLQSPDSSFMDPFVMFWARVVDYSARPFHLSFDEGFTYVPATGAYLMEDHTLKKAFLQSAPWAILAFVVFAAAWAPRLDRRRTQLRYLSVITAAVLAVFSFSGVTRDDGLAFNQRYLLELLPLAAVAFAWSIDGLELSLPLLLRGFIIGQILLAIVLLGPLLAYGSGAVFWGARQVAQLKVPMFLAAATAGLWLLARSRPSLRRALAVMVGVCLGWACLQHLEDDVVTAARLRQIRFQQATALAQVLPGDSALILYATAGVAGPLLLDRDIVILDARIDNGQDAPVLIQQLLDRHRRVFLLDDGFPRDVRERTARGFELLPMVRGTMDLFELRASPAPFPAGQ